MLSVEDARFYGRVCCIAGHVISVESLLRCIRCGVGKVRGVWRQRGLFETNSVTAGASGLMGEKVEGFSRGSWKAGTEQKGKLLQGLVRCRPRHAAVSFVFTVSAVTLGLVCAGRLCELPVLTSSKIWRLLHIQGVTSVASGNECCVCVVFAQDLYRKTSKAFAAHVCSQTNRAVVLCICR